MLQESLEAGVVGSAVIGTNLESSQIATDLAKKHSSLLAVIGLHPLDQEVLDLDHLMQSLEKILHESQSFVKAIGECGLDYAYLPSDQEKAEQEKERQLILFKRQLELAQKVQLPIVVHCRNAHVDLFPVLDTSIKISPDIPIIFHCMSGTIEDLERALHYPNSYISYAANITYPKSEHLREMVKQTPRERLLIETDAPYLPPQSHRGKMNHPAMIIETGEAMADILSMQAELLGEQLIENAKRVYHHQSQ